MTATLKIARRELRSLFFSPIAWVLLAIFVVHVSIAYVDMVRSGIQSIFNGGLPSLTSRIFAMGFGLGPLDQLATALMFYVPLLTMGLISRERQNGSIRLLMSSPVTLWQVVLGKFLAMAGYLLLFVAFLLVLMTIAAVLVDNLDIPHVLTGILGIYLLACTYAAVGLFMSSLTNHQLVAAISTIALLAALAVIGTVGQRIPMVADIAYWLSIDGRVGYLRQGLIASKDVLYFLSIIVLFLVFTHLKLSAGRRVERVSVRAVKYGATFAVVVVFGYVTSLPGLTGYADMTRNKAMTLTPGSLEVVAGMRGTLDMTAYINALDWAAYQFLPAQRNRRFRQVFEQHERQIGRIGTQYRYYYADADNDRLYAANPGVSNETLARRYADQNRLDFDAFLSQQEVDERYRMKDENYSPVYKVTWQGATTVMRTFRDIRYFPGEPEISAALKRLLVGPKTVGYVTGRGARRALRRGAVDHFALTSNIADRSALINQGFDVTELTLDAPVAGGIDILVLAAPTGPLPPAALAHLRAYIAAGRDLLIMGEPGTQAIMNPITAELGVAFQDGQLREPKEDFPDDVIFAAFTTPGDAIGFAVPLGGLPYPIVLSGATGLDYRPDGPFTVTPVLADEGGEVSLAVAMERAVGERTQRIVVVGDADFMSTATLSLPEPDNTYNEEFVLDIFGYLSHGDYPIDTTRPLPLDTHIAIDLKQVDYLKILLYGAIPAALLLSGGSLLLQRRRR